MQVLVTSEQRFDRSPDGALWAPGPLAYQFWTRYLAVFTQITVLARVREAVAPPAGYQRADGPSVRFAAIPHFVGPAAYATAARRGREVAAAAVAGAEGLILRVPSTGVAQWAEEAARRAGRAYAVEVVGDPYDVFAPGSTRHPLRPFLRWWLPRRLRRQCARACAAAYVTERALQRRYPPSPGAFTTHYSSIELPASWFATGPRLPRCDGPPLRLVTVASLEYLAKAPDVLIDAVAQCVRQGLDLTLRFVGDGRLRPGLEARAAARGVGGRIAFLGALPAGEAVRAELDAADIFVLASRTEGLPRAMIEAMARGLPCLGSTAGGIPELLAEEDLVSPGSAGALAQKVREVAASPQRLRRMSARNLARAADYREDVLAGRRAALYRALQQAVGPRALMTGALR